MTSQGIYCEHCDNTFCTCPPPPDPKKVANAHKNARTRGKVWEREVAKALHTQRTGPTGLDDADIRHDTLGVECKAYSRLALREADLQQTERNAKGRIPLLALKEFRTGRKLWVMQFDFGTQLLLNFLEETHE